MGALLHDLVPVPQLALLLLRWSEPRACCCQTIYVNECALKLQNLCSQCAAPYDVHAEATVHNQLLLCVLDHTLITLHCCSCHA
jgi:hypothetical protein